MAEPECLVTDQQQLMLEQIEELLGSDQNSEAMILLSRLSDQGPGLVRSSQIQRASTQRVQVFRTLQDWCRLKQNAALSTDALLAAEYRKQWNAQSEAAYRLLQHSKEHLQADQLLTRYHATDLGPALARLLIDILLEEGQGVSSMKVLDDYFTELTRLDLSLISDKSPAVLVPWYRVWQVTQPGSAISQQLMELWNSRTQQCPDTTADVLSRQLISAAMNSEHFDLDAVVQWAECVVKQIEEPIYAQKLQAVIDSVRDWSEENKSSLQADFNLERWPDWQIPIERYSNAYDLTPATLPRVGQRESMLPVIPAIHEGTVFLHELTRIRAVNLQTGTPWPVSTSELPLFDTQTAPETYIPLGYPLMGFPRGKVTVIENCLYARMGAPVTAWANRIRSSDGSSISYLIGLDLDSQGKMLQGFPRHLLSAELENAEFEGCPVVHGFSVITTVTQRDHGNIRRRLAAFDRFSGKLLWISQVLGSGRVVGSHRANLISHAQPVVAGGLVYFASDLGTVTCLNSQTGRTIWMASYQRAVDQPADYPRPNRFRYRDGNPCEVRRGLVYCMPQDCPEVFALDALTGDLVWSTSEIDVADCSHFVGVIGKTLIVSGDRIVWLDCLSGSVVGRFAEFTTPGTLNSLPQPRGIGQAALVGDRVYWPTSTEIYVFKADLAAEESRPTKTVDSPVLIKRFTTGARGAEGANLVARDGWFLMATPGRLYCLRSE